MEQQIVQWKKQLTAAGFQEASKVPNHYFKIDTPLTAFFLNLYTFDDRISLYYGYASIAFIRMKNNETSLADYGISEAGSSMRFHAAIRGTDDAAIIGTEIQETLDRYRGTEKDALLEMIREKRKDFLNRITLQLKPLGFRKKGNEWRKNLSDNHIIYFWADRSPYSDTYNFPIAIAAQNKNFKNRYYCTIGTLQPPENRVFDCQIHSSHRFDWQLHTHEDLTELIHRFLRLYVTPAENGMECLGKEEYIWKGCLCQLDCCDQCWVEKNHKNNVKN